MTIYNHKKLLYMSSAQQRGGQTGQQEAGASPICRGYRSVQAGREGTPWAQSLGKMCGLVVPPSPRSMYSTWMETLRAWASAMM